MSKQIETITFFTCLREAIALSIQSMEGLDESHKESLSSFVLNEASDYEIAHFAIMRKFPKEKYNIVKENVLVDVIKEELFFNSPTLLETMSSEQVDTLLESIESPSSYGLSSSPLILNHLAETGVLSLILKEDSNWRKSFGRSAFGFAPKKKEPSDMGAVGDEIANKKEKDYGLFNYKKSFGPGTTSSKEEVLKGLQHGGEQIAKRLNKASNAAVKAGEKAADAAKEGLQRGGEKIVNKLNKASNAVVKAGEKAAGAAKKYINQANQEAGIKAKPSKSDMGAVGDEIASQKRASKSDMGAVGDEIASQGGASKQVTKGNSAAEVYNQVRGYVQKNAKPIGASLVVAGLLYGAYKTYKRFFSKAARACSNQSGAAKTACMEKFKKTAIKAQISDLRKSLTACKHSTNPQKCSAPIQAKIQKLQAKL